MDRVVSLRVFLAVALGVSLLRLSHLQLVRGGRYRRLAEGNRMRLVPEESPRGLMVDRHGRVLASNHAVFRVALVPQELQDLEAVLNELSPAVHLSPEALRRRFTAERSFAFMPAVVASHVPKEVALRWEEARWRLPGLLIKPAVLRHYPRGSSAAHLLGYLSQPTAEELPLLKQYGVRPKYLVGRMGLERLLDHALQGTHGGLMVEVNHRARQVRTIGRRTPRPGARVVLTIDAQLQSLIEGSFGPQPGACVVLDPFTGAVLAMVSLPAFSPEAFAASDTKAIKGFLDDPHSPLMNRGTAGVYQPGSIMKLVTAAAALEHQRVTPGTSVTCLGSITIGDRVFHCWNRDGHGAVTLSEALMQSCNVYFIQVARRLGAQRLRAAQQRMGFSHRTGWPLEEQAGHVPQRPLTEGEVGLLGIGQGEILVTPLQVALMGAAFANGGSLVVPWVVSTIADTPVPHRGVPRALGWSQATMDAVRTGMQRVVSHPAGTGHRAFTESVTIAGKTGTAQTHVPGRTHAWFVGFCPVEAPRAAMAIVAEYGGSGGELPAEIARAICEYLALPATPSDPGQPKSL